MQLGTVKIEKPEDVNFILGQSHFIKTVEDGEKPKGVEAADDIAWRKEILRKIGYKL